MRRFLGIFIVGLLLVAVVMSAIVWMLLRGVGGLDDWVVRQLVGVAESYIVPDISFDTFEVDRFGRITLKGVSFKASDGTEVIGADSLRVALAEPPSRGRPIQIKTVEFQGGALRLVRDRSVPGKKFIGLTPFLRRAAIQQPETVKKEFRLDETMRIRNIALRQTTIVYDPADGRPAMTIDDLTADLAIEPDKDAHEHGWYRIGATIDRTPVLAFNLNGRFNIDSLTLDFQQSALRMAMSEQTYEALPVAAQSFLRKHDVIGDIEGVIEGTYTMKRWRDSTLDIRLALRDINMAMGKGRLPIESGGLRITFANKKMELSLIDLRTLGGRANMALVMDLVPDDHPTTYTWRLQGVRLEKAIRARQQSGKKTSLAGIVHSHGKATATASNWRQSLRGEGELRIRKGRLLLIPVVRSISKMLFAGDPKDGPPRDDVDASFTLRADAMNFSKWAITTPVVAAHGSGLLYYDGRIDLVANGGPMERVQRAMGQVGALLGALTDSVLKYHITGTLKDPKVSVKPLGIGAKTHERNDHADASPPVEDEQ